MIHLVCYANERFRFAQQRLVKSAGRNGVDVVHAFGPADIRGTDFYARHKHILDQPRGGGYWLWKPYFIRKVLNEVAPGDFVLYVDSGAEIISPVNPLIDVCRAAGNVLIFRYHGHANRYWTKRDCYVLMGCDTESCYDTEHATAGFSAYIAGHDAKRFTEEWLTHCADARKLTDAPNEAGLPNLPEFLEHRHDQAILSLLAYSWGLYLYRDPTQFGNHMKAPGLRLPNEYLQVPYMNQPCDRSPYPTLFNHHRDVSRQLSAPERTGKRLVNWLKRLVRSHLPPKERPNPYFSSADLALAIRRNRETLSAVPEWFDPTADAASKFGYGVPPSCRHRLSQPVGSQETLPDLIVHLTDCLGSRLNYLEVGVSVGKNFFQVLRAGQDRNLTGLDIEEIHPNLSRRLKYENGTELRNAPPSLKQTSSKLSVYADTAAGNRVRYLSGDIFNHECWARLEGQQFNAMFFKFNFNDYNALRGPEGLMYEWKMIRRYGLLDLNEFVMVWDDLGGFMTMAFERIAAQLQAETGEKCAKLSFPIRGSLGVNEPPHQIGLVAKLGKMPDWISRHEKR
jgi:hypothetical protein